MDELSGDWEGIIPVRSWEEPMHVKWVKRKLPVPDGIDRVILPGWWNGDLSELTAQFRVPFELGPKDLFDLPEYFGQKGRKRPLPRPHH